MSTTPNTACAGEYNTTSVHLVRLKDDQNCDEKTWGKGATSAPIRGWPGRSYFVAGRTRQAGRVSRFNEWSPTRIHNWSAKRTSAGNALIRCQACHGRQAPCPQPATAAKHKTKRAAAAHRGHCCYRPQIPPWRRCPQLDGSSPCAHPVGVCGAGAAGGLCSHPVLLAQAQLPGMFSCCPSRNVEVRVRDQEGGMCAGDLGSS